MTEPKLITGGTFDLFHSGHVNFLKQCKRLVGDGEVIVVLNRDEFVARYKRKPILSLKERIDIISSCIYVDKVVVNNTDEDWKPNIETLNPDIIAIGTDWAKKDYYKQLGVTQKYLDENLINLVYIPYTEDISTTDIIKRIKG